MRRSVLFSLLIMGAAMSVVISAGTFGAFSDEEVISGTVTAGVVDIELQAQSCEHKEAVDTDDTGECDDDEDSDSLTLLFDDTDCPADYFAPGDVCTIAVTVTRDSTTPALAQQLAIDLSAIAEIDDADCSGDSTAEWTAVIQNWTDTTDNTVPAGADETQYMPAGIADTETFDLVVTLVSGAGNTCQGDSILVTVTVTADQDALPHNTQDDETPAP